MANSTWIGWFGPTQGSSSGSGPTFPDLTVTGTINLPATTGASAGVLTQGGSSFLHSFYDADSDFPNTNLFIGRGAGNFTLAPTGAEVQGDASQLVGVGYNALHSVTTGSGLTAVGSNAMGGATSTVDSVAVGTNALAQTNGDAADNTAIGYAVMQGDGAGVSNTGNTGVGHTSMFSLTSGKWNTAAGKQSLFALTTGIENSALGFSAGGSIIDGRGNAVVGFQALMENEGGDYNAVLGYEAAFNTTGDNNVAIGFHALFANLGGSTNTAVGYGSGSGVTTGSQNVLIGYNAGANITTGSNNLIIGTNNLNAASATADGQMNLGGVLVGFNSNGATPGLVGTFLAGAANAPSVKIGDAGLYQEASGKISFSTANARQMSLEAGFLTIWNQTANLRFGTSPDVVIRRSAANTLTIDDGGGGAGNLVVATNMRAASYNVGATAGVSFSGAITNITVVNGIVTAAS